jgi:hypothetical protein
VRRQDSTGSAGTVGSPRECFRSKSKVMEGIAFGQQYIPTVVDIFSLARTEAVIFWLPNGMSSQGPQQSSWDDRALVSEDLLLSTEKAGGRQEPPKEGSTAICPSVPRQRTHPSPASINTLQTYTAMRRCAIVLVFPFTSSALSCSQLPLL